MNMSGVFSALGAEATNLLYRLPSLHPSFEWWIDCAIVKHRYRQRFGRRPDLSVPTTFSEKVLYKRFYDRRPILTCVADKLAVRDYVAGIIGPEYLPCVFRAGRSIADLRWDDLPARFVVKASHGSGWNIIVQDRTDFDEAAAEAQVGLWLKSTFYLYTREWCYRDIPPGFLIEEFLEGQNGEVPDDWKFFVYHGRAVYLQIDRGRFLDHRHSFYTRDLERVDVRYLCDNLDVDPTWPSNLTQMFDLAERLGRDFDFVRVDLYNVCGRLVFGELTNYPNAGLMPFEPQEMDCEFGRHWKLPSTY